jgi:ribosome-binding factor A
MESTRQQKINRLLQRDLGDIFQQEGPALSRAMVSVTRVKVSPDLAQAKVYLSIFGIEDKPAELESLRKKTKEIRHKLARKVKSQLRLTPQLDFFLDDSLDYIERIEDLLES